MPRRRGNGPEHTQARHQAQKATVRGLVADVVVKAHAAHAAALHDPADSARAFLGEAALPTVRALNEAGAPMLLPAMHLVVNAVQPGLIGPEAALYEYWMEWRTPNQSGRPLSMGEALLLTGEGSATSLQSSAPALPHALRTRHSMDTAQYLKQARAECPRGLSELDAELHLGHPPDEELEVGEVTIFLQGAGETPYGPRLTKPVYDGTRPTPPYAVVCESFPREATWCPALPLATHAPRGWAHRRLSPPLSRSRGANHRGECSLARAPGHPGAPPRRHNPRRPRAGPGGHCHPPLWGSAGAPAPPPGARGAGRGARLPADPGGHRCYGGPPFLAPPGNT